MCKTKMFIDSLTGGLIEGEAHLPAIVEEGEVATTWSRVPCFHLHLP
jgi:hypothetical protein